MLLLDGVYHSPPLSPDVARSQNKKIRKHLKRLSKNFKGANDYLYQKASSGLDTVGTSVKLNNAGKARIYFFLGLNDPECIIHGPYSIRKGKWRGRDIHMKNRIASPNTIPPLPMEDVSKMVNLERNFIREDCSEGFFSLKELTEIKSLSIKNGLLKMKFVLEGKTRRLRSRVELRPITGFIGDPSAYCLLKGTNLPFSWVSVTGGDVGLYGVTFLRQYAGFTNTS